jgi:intracellular sulfur oxidation DsrE/DsrF family protein
MKAHARLGLLVIGFMVLAFVGHAQTPSNLIIKDYGTINDIADIIDPDPNIDYKIVIDLKAASPDPNRINPGLNNIARMLNLHAAGGISPDKIYVVAAIHGSATFTVLDNTGYQLKYGIDNPNVDLIKQLKAAGVKLFVCGQSLVARNNGFDNVNPDIEIALSMLTVVTAHQQKGYGLLVFQ